MTETKELQQLHLYYSINLLLLMTKENKRTTISHLLIILFFFCYVCIKFLKKTNVGIGALQNLPVLFSFWH